MLGISVIQVPCKLKQHPEIVGNQDSFFLRKKLFVVTQNIRQSYFMAESDKKQMAITLFEYSTLIAQATNPHNIT